jgi:hypothetical protein
MSTATSNSTAADGAAARFEITDPDASAKFNGDQDTRTLGTPLTFDFKAPAADPDYLVERLWERGTSNVVSAPKSAGKSFAMLDLCIVVAMGGGVWLGREVKGGPVLYLDEENPKSRLERRWKALARVRGFGNEHLPNLDYLLKQGVRLDEGSTMALLERTIAAKNDAAERPGLTVIDTTTSMTNADLNSNRDAAKVMVPLRAIAGRTGEVIVVLHHRRKAQQVKGQTMNDDPDAAAMGAQAWTNQVDAHSTWSRKGAQEQDYEADELDPFATPTGRWRLRTEFDWVPDHTMRDGGVARPERVVIESVKDARGVPLWARVYSEGVAQRGPSRPELLAARIGRWLHANEGEHERGAILEALDEPKSGTANDAFKIALEKGWAAQEKERAPWRAGDQEPPEEDRPPI